MALRFWYVCEICGARFQVVLPSAADKENVKCINPHDDDTPNASAKPES